MRVPGDALLQILENSVAKYPASDGRFACMSGLKFSFDPERPEGSRVHSVRTLAGGPFDLSNEARYTMAVMKWIAKGMDGYLGFKHPDVDWLTDPGAEVIIQDIVV